MFRRHFFLRIRYAADASRRYAFLVRLPPLMPIFAAAIAFVSMVIYFMIAAASPRHTPRDAIDRLPLLRCCAPRCFCPARHAYDACCSPAVTLLFFAAAFSPDTMFFTRMPERHAAVATLIFRQALPYAARR